MILVTGATGNIGTALLRQLSDRGAGPLRALTRNAARATFPAGVEAMAGDLARPETLGPALDGVRALFLVSGMGADADVLAAARRAGVEHVVLVSSITVQTHPDLPAARQNLAVETLLRDSGMAWTILRPTQFASNALWWAESIRVHGTVHAPYPDTGLPTIHPGDIASVARLALTEPGHRGQIHALTGPERITAPQQVEAIAAALGRDLTFVEISREEAHRRMAPVMGSETADAVLDVTGGDVNADLSAVRDTVPRLTGCPGTPFRRWATENAAAFRAAAPAVG
ncbi:NAD(P)H-binding protein [Streptomyces sp. NPDC101227]|uniref:NAD(P)H-binding protein n=1 Tax=Streptomyces sp. NPDC101227 TaxID=3366136 RepID=UPI003816D0C7